MKKLLFLLSAMVVFFLNACGDDSSSNAKNDVTGSSESIVESSATETAESSSSEVENATSSSSGNIADSTEADVPAVDSAASEKMLVAYYSFTGNSKAIVETLTGMILPMLLKFFLWKKLILQQTTTPSAMLSLKQSTRIPMRKAATPLSPSAPK